MKQLNKQYQDEDINVYDVLSQIENLNADLALNVQLINEKQAELNRLTLMLRAYHDKEHEKRKEIISEAKTQEETPSSGGVVSKDSVEMAPLRINNV